MRLLGILPAAALIASEATAQEASTPPPVKAVAEPGVAGWPAPAVPVVSYQPQVYYPFKALLRDQEGAVTFGVLIDREGVPRECRIISTSGHRELDEGTCEHALLYRFVPAKNESGEAVENSFVRQIMWMLPRRKRRPFADTTMIVRISLVSPYRENCEITADGPLSSDWTKVGCRALSRIAAQRLAAAPASAMRGAQIIVRMLPVSGEGVEPRPSEQAESFQIADVELGRTYVSRCRLREAETRGPPLLDGHRFCVLFASSVFRFERSPDNLDARRAVLTIELVPGAE